MSAAPTYNSKAPECPNCGHTVAPNEARHYDPCRYTEDACAKCSVLFSVEVMIVRVLWRCEAA
jgi:hypothetical protein